MQKESKAKLIPKRKQGRALNVNGAFPDLREDSDQNTPCGLKYLSVYSVQNVAGSRARKVKRGIMKCVLGPQAESSSYVEMLAFLQLKLK